MFRKDEPVCVALSGGKDSMSLLFVLKKQGYTVSAIHLDMELGILSEVSRKIVSEFSEAEGFPLKIIPIRQEIGKGLKESARILKRHICSICGMVRRYILNREGLSYACVATAHTLDDETAFLLGNMYSVQTDQDSVHEPVLNALPKFARKVKPFCFISEQEIRLYAQVQNIPFVRDRCPYGSGATTHYYKKALDFLEEKMPSSRLRFYKNMLRQKSSRREPEVISNYCSACGYPTTKVTCGYCRMRERIKEG